MAPLFSWGHSLRLAFARIGNDANVEIGVTVTEAWRFRFEFTAQYAANNGDVFTFSGSSYHENGRDSFMMSLHYDSYTPADPNDPGNVDTVVLQELRLTTQDFLDEINIGQKLVVDFTTPPGTLASFDIQVSGSLNDPDSGEPLFPMSFSARGMDGDHISAMLQFPPEIAEELGLFYVAISFDMDGDRLTIVPRWPGPEVVIGGLQIDRLIVTGVAEG